MASIVLSRGGGLNTKLKFVITISVTILSVFLLVQHQSWKPYPVLLSVIVPVLFFAATLNEHEIWAVVRFSKFLIIPLWLLLHYRNWKIGSVRLKPLFPPLIVLMLLSNLFFLYYIKIYQQ